MKPSRTGLRACRFLFLARRVAAFERPTVVDIRGNIRTGASEGCNHHHPWG